MPTKKPRLNVVLNELTMDQLSELASKRRKSLSIVASELIEEAMELQEDRFFSRLAESRDKPGKKRIKHKDAWG